MSEEIPMGLTMKEKHAVTKQLALTYKRAGKKKKGKTEYVNDFETRIS